MSRRSTSRKLSPAICRVPQNEKDTVWSILKSPLNEKDMVWSGLEGPHSPPTQVTAVLTFSEWKQREGMRFRLSIKMQDQDET